MIAKGAETLPSKIAHDYKAIVKLYDAKNYKKGLKHAQKILELHPDHPQTNSLKALCELALGEEAKAQVTAKAALLKSKMSSCFCWNTYGTVMKQKRNYAEAAKCYQMASNFQKDNMQLLRQTASLQIQIRDHNSHVATRLKILKLKPNMIHNWVSFAVAQHLKGDFEQLYKALQSLQNLVLSADLKPIEISHYLVYRAIAFFDGQKYDRMYEQLSKNKQKILDEDVWNDLMRKCCLKLNKPEQARKCIQFLLKKYPENIQYMQQYKKQLNIPSRELFQKIGTQFGSKLAKVYQLCGIQDKSQFKKEFIQYIKPFFQKNLISLFSQIQVIYQTTSYENIIEEVFLETQASLKNDNKYLDGTQAAFPTQYLWSIYLLAQHYSRNFSTLKKAHEYIVRSIQHTNTITQFYIVKAQIQYKMHNNVAAVQTINQARKTDLADRYMNNICVKYLMKCMKPSLAEDVLRLFMRDEVSLYQLQNQWYIIEAAKSYLKLKNIPAGLRHLQFIEKQFQDIQANQYDFHTYCIRKWTLRQYLQCISFNDNIYKDKKYAQAAGYAIQHLIQYVHVLKAQQLKQKQQVKEQTKQEEAAKKKKKKKKQKVQKEQEELTPIQAFRKKIDFFGKQYSQKIKANPMDQALVYAQNVGSAKYVNKSNKKENKLYAKAFSNSIRVFIHYNKPLMVIRTLKKLIKTEYDPFLTLASTLRSILYLQNALANEKTHELTKQFIKQFLTQLLGTKTVEEFYKENLSKLPQSFNRQIRLGEIQLIIQNKDTRENLITLYKNELGKIIKSQAKDVTTLQVVFYICHKLQFYNQFDNQLKGQLNKILGDQTTYFTDWFDAIDKLPGSTWGMYWLSAYDIKREEEGGDQKDKKEQEQKNGTQPKQGQTKQNNV